MLKITVRNDGTEQTLLVEGKLAGPWAAESNQPGIRLGRQTGAAGFWSISRE